MMPRYEVAMWVTLDADSEDDAIATVASQVPPFLANEPTWSVTEVAPLTDD